MEPSEYTQLALLCAALACEVRLSIIEALHPNEKTEAEIASSVQLSLPATSEHLTQLLRAGVLVTRKRGSRLCYSLSGPQVLSALMLLESRYRSQSFYRLFNSADA